MADIFSSLATLGFPQILLWLLTFAVVYGVLSHVGEKGMPKSNAARAIISMVAAFMVLFGTPAALITVMTKMSASLILVVVALLIMIVFLEVLGVKFSREVETIGLDKEGRPVKTKTPVNVSLFEKYMLEFGVILLLLVVYIFFASGGADLIGMPRLYFNQQTIATLAFFGVIIAAIMWMIKGK
ncbi:MAG: hypothetical protein PHU12_03150 [Candidatus Aenigmarchaeota archaeon]|nr:hypothetical protein [Candidatus Aenigmarchaeota archaeon]